MPAISLLPIQVAENIFDLNAVLDQFLSGGPGAAILLVLTNYNFQGAFCAFSIFS
jgi:hypothetical protein